MHSHRFALPFAYFSCMLLAASVAAAQTPPAAPLVVGEVHASGSHRYSDAQIAATSGLKPGDAVSRDQLQEIADGLAQIGGLFTRQLPLYDKDRRTTVTFELQDAPIVPVMFDNFPWFTDQELSDEIRGAVPLFDGGAPRDGGLLLEQITSALSAKLATREIKANVEHTLVAQPGGDDMIMQFRQDGPASPSRASLSAIHWRRIRRSFTTASATSSERPFLVLRLNYSSRNRSGPFILPPARSASSLARPSSIRGDPASMHPRSTLSFPSLLVRCFTSRASIGAATRCLTMPRFPR